MSERSAPREATDDQRRIMLRDFVPLNTEEFRRAYSVFMAGVAGEVPADPDFPKEVLNAATGLPEAVEDSAFTRGWIAAAKLFDDDARRISFGKRMEIMLQAVEGKYRKHVNFEAGSIHVALLATIAQVRFSARTNPKALRAAFDAEFKQQIARTVQPSDQPSIH